MAVEKEGDVNKTLVRKVLQNQYPSVMVRYLCPGCQKKHSDFLGAVLCAFACAKTTHDGGGVVDQMFDAYLVGKNTKSTYIAMELYSMEQEEPILVKNPVQLHRELEKLMDNIPPVDIWWEAQSYLLALTIAIVFVATAYLRTYNGEWSSGIGPIAITTVYLFYATRLHGNSGSITILPLSFKKAVVVLVLTVLGFIGGLVMRGVS
jgi:hypothetical protein